MNVLHPAGCGRVSLIVGGGLRVSGRIGRGLISTWCAGRGEKKKGDFVCEASRAVCPLVWAENLKLADPGRFVSPGGRGGTGTGTGSSTQ